MDFSRTDEQVAIADLAGQILTKHATPERLRTLEDDPAWTGTDAELWAALAEANLLGLTVPTDHGGSGLGLVEACELLEQAGRTVAPVPLLATVAYAVPVLAHYGSPEQQAAWLPGVVAGDVVLTAALVEALGDPLRPSTTASPDGDGWVLSGTKVCVPSGLVADRVLVAASTPAGEVGLFLVDPAQAGVTVSRQDTVSRVPEAMIELDGARVGAAALVGPLDGDATTVVVRAPARHGGHRRVHDGGGRGRPEAHGRLHQHPRAVRAADRDLPGGRAARGRRLHRHPGDPPHHAARGLAARRRP